MSERSRRLQKESREKMRPLTEALDALLNENMSLLIPTEEEADEWELEPPSGATVAVGHWVLIAQLEDLGVPDAEGWTISISPPRTKNSAALGLLADRLF